MASDRATRRLSNLSKSASTSRVLNLHAIHKAGNLAHEHKAPFCENILLNRAIILKHTLRPSEIDLFDGRSGVCTKVLIPIDDSDLRCGAHYFFVGERSFDSIADELFNHNLRPGFRDRTVLDLVDQMPSLDPFLLRENIRRINIHPAREYFNISDADILKMQNFVRDDIQSLVQMSTEDESSISASRLGEKLLSNNPETDLGPLRTVLRMEEKAFLDGVFAWRGFLYYKWVLTQVMPNIDHTINSILWNKPKGVRHAQAEAFIPGARNRIVSAIRAKVRSIEATLEQYDIAYQGMTLNGQPKPFRDFLITSPDMFATLGCQLGWLQHIISFWAYRFPKSVRNPVGYEELMDIFVDFEDGLAAENLEDYEPPMRLAGMLAG